MCVVGRAFRLTYWLRSRTIIGGSLNGIVGTSPLLLGFLGGRGGFEGGVIRKTMVGK